ncbi:hypothetical protein AYI69_g2130 [Smittium culicis]|uniref:Uncharacterized protein n=1 Tax=Smittium culicis TaxID=133412 RepID=A0A1R1YND6_9FUNG|nr:hypothetical protein AYI69_g2130 [Smittium culicis]
MFSLQRYRILVDGNSRVICRYAEARNTFDQAHSRTGQSIFVKNTSIVIVRMAERGTGYTGCSNEIGGNFGTTCKSRCAYKHLGGLVMSRNSSGGPFRR